MISFSSYFSFHNRQLPDFKRCGQERHLARVPKAFLHYRLKQQERWHLRRRKCHQSVVSLRLSCWRVWIITINCRLQALALNIIVRDFRRVYKQRDLYPRGLVTEIKKSALKQAIVVQIKISISLTDLLIKVQNIMITRFNLRREGVGGGRGAYNQMY